MPTFFNFVFCLFISWHSIIPSYFICIYVVKRGVFIARGCFVWASRTVAEFVEIAASKIRIAILPPKLAGCMSSSSWLILVALLFSFQLHYLFILSAPFHPLICSFHILWFHLHLIYFSWPGLNEILFAPSLYLFSSTWVVFIVLVR